MKLTDNVKLERLKETFSRYIGKVQSTYTASFPETERRDFYLFCRLVEDNPDFEVLVILKNEQYVGFLTYWNFHDFVFVENFAIDEAARGGGIGSITMRESLKLMGRKVVLEVETVVDELTLRRVNFYEALGFTLHEKDYKQPPYRESDSWYDLKLMTYGEFDMDKQFESIRDKIYCKVYGVKKPD